MSGDKTNTCNTIAIQLAIIYTVYQGYNSVHMAVKSDSEGHSSK